MSNTEAQPGKVYLVGAGPGDPSLPTLRAAELLKTCDVILPDDLVSDDILDLGVGAALISLLGMHWEFLPSFLAKLVPGVDLVPFWSLAVANVYRKSKTIAAAAEEARQHPPAFKDAGHS